MSLSLVLTILVLTTLAAAMFPPRFLVRAWYRHRATSLLRQRYIPSAGVLSMLSLRMDAAHGVPTVWEKLAALFGGDGANNASVLAGDQRDLTTAETDLLGLFQPLLHTVESTGLTDLSAVIQKVLTGASGITSVSTAVALVTTAIEGEVPTIQQQAAAIGKTSLTTLVSAALASLGHLDLPVI
jgi:hypothetical protein